VSTDLTVSTVLPLARPRHRGGMPWPAARAIAGSVGRPLPAEPVPLAQAVGRRLASDLVARVPLPSADLSAMDGWAVAGPPPWQVVGDLPAGTLPTRAIATGECVRIATGAVVPHGADAVLPVEHAVDSGRQVRPYGTAWPPSRRHVRLAGEEALAGDLLLPAGTPVTPPVVGLAAATGHDSLRVGGIATVAVLVLGDELTDHGVPTRGRTRDALGPQLPGWLTALGTAPPHVRRLPDSLEALTTVVRTSEAAIVLTTGGTSVGPHDHVRTAIQDLGGVLLVDGVDVKPGHPMLLAALPDGRYLAGLPGNPLAACVALLTLVQPLIARLHDATGPALGTVRLTAHEPARDGDGHRLLPVRRTNEGAEVLPSCGSAMLRGLAAATGLAVVGPGGARSGDEVSYLPLPW
jgi:molybdopterin molybdotransferase